MKKVGKVVCALALVVFMLTVPSLLGEALSQEIYKQWLSPKERVWEGVIRVWCVSAEHPVDGELLAKTVKQFEKQYPGAFVETASLREESVQKRFAKGRTPPDVWILSEGMTFEGIQESMRFELPLPPEPNVLEESFEFDVNAPDVVPVEKRISFVIAFACEGEKREMAEVFARFLAENAENMLK